ncbi:MAG: aminotransferase class I/II-fold pyridoxal phosphate-dependent enzyme [Anaerolineae bacterium]|nr:aminotransferase class I/II-fold pyridoxal phosphate-dependent enzyme [Anaerolineae bacterium]
MNQFSQRVARFQRATAATFQFFTDSPYARRGGEPGIADFALGNPHDMPLPGFVEAIQRWSAPLNKDWFAYKMNEEPARQAIAASLRDWRQVAFETEDIFLTTGAFAALSVALTAIVDPGDEVIFISPPWFFYEGLIAAADGVPVRVKVNPTTLGLDIDAIAAAITPKTRAIIVNSPNNPTGLIYPPDDLRALSDVLSAASQRSRRTIYLLSDEAYSRIIYDGRPYHSPTSFYPDSLLIYTYGKTLLTPGQRVGYIALPRTMQHREPLRLALLSAQIMTGYAFPNALLQYALGDLEKVSIDVAHLQRKRDRLVGALREAGYEVHVPQGTFYLLPRSPLPDDWAFIELLAEFDIFCLPGTIVEMPGYFRISLTASDQMIDQAIPGFTRAIKRARSSISTRQQG